MTSKHIKAAPEVRGGRHHSAIHQFSQHRFLCSLPDAVHPANPPQLVRSLQLLIHAFSFGHLSDDLPHAFPAGLIDFQQMRPEPAGQNQLLIQPGAVFLKVCMAHAAVFPKRFSFHGNGEIRDEVVSAGGCS